MRFRRALSLAIDRHEINQVVYSAWHEEGAKRCCRQARCSSRDYQRPMPTIDVAAANDLLDEVGLTKRDDKGFRLLPDGRPLTVIVDTAGQIRKNRTSES